MTPTYIICSLCGESVTAEGYASGALLTCDMCSDLGDGPAQGEIESTRNQPQEDDYEEFADLDHRVPRR